MKTIGQITHDAFMGLLGIAIIAACISIFGWWSLLIFVVLIGMG